MTNSPWSFVGLWLKRHKRTEALFYWEQAEHFFNASVGLPMQSAPLLLYYSFMNAAKALLATKAIAFDPMHGVKGQTPGGTSRKIGLNKEGVRILTKGVLPALCSYYHEPENIASHSLTELLFNVPFVHRTFCLTYTSQTEMYLPLKNCRYVFDWGSGNVHFAADFANDVRRIQLAKRLGAYARNSKSGAALRIGLGDLAQAQLSHVIQTQLDNLQIAAQECLIVLDLSDADLSPCDQFAKFATERLFELHALGTWPRIILRMTSYPRKNPAAKNTSCLVSRAEWIIWQHILQLDPAVKDFVIFGDFGADNARVDFSPGGGGAIPHLRYATDSEWLVVRGGDDWRTIRSAAASIVSSHSFSGELFSAGDEFIASRARGSGGIGNPMIWRSVNMNHHMSLLISSLAPLYGAPTLEPRRRRKAVQEELFVEPANDPLSGEIADGRR